MSRLLLSAVFALSVGVVVADDTAKTPATFADKAKALSADYTKAMQAYSKASKSGTAEEKTTATKDLIAAQTKMRKGQFELAKSEPKNAQSMQFAIGALGMEPATAKEAGEFLIEHYGDTDKILTAVPAIASAPGGDRLIDRLAATVTTKERKAVVQFAGLKGMVENTDYPRGGPKTAADEAAKRYATAKTKLAGLVKEYGELPSAAAVSSRPNAKAAPTVAEAAGKLEFFIDNLTVGKKAPEIDGELLDGKRAKLSDYRGKVVVLDVWATWCGPCRAMIPHERELVSHLKGKPFELISVSADEKKETLTKFLDKEPMPWTHWWTGNKEGFVETYQIRFYPTIYVLDGKGVIRFKHVRGPAMDEAVETLLKEAAKAGA